MADQPIYLDYNATTPIDPAVCAAMLPYLQQEFGNPSSGHVYGSRAHRAVEQARCEVAQLLGAAPEEIVFTGGGSEANNHALKGVLLPLLLGEKGSASSHFDKRAAAHVITSVVEHPAVAEPCRFLQRMGCALTVLSVDRCGLVDPAALEQALKRNPTTRLVSIMHANNEVGTLEPIAEISHLCRAHGVLLHSDAAQSVGKIPVDVETLGVDLLSLAGHKLYAPKGVGALYVRQGVRLEPLIHGAGHEGGRRAGTENVAYLVALGKACDLAKQHLHTEFPRLQSLRDRLANRLREHFGDDLALNGHPQQRLPNTLSVSFPGITGHDLLQQTPEIAASTGSACHSGNVTLSPVLQAMGITPAIGSGTVRFSVGRFTTAEEADRAARLLAERYHACRK